MRWLSPGLKAQDRLFYQQKIQIILMAGRFYSGESVHISARLWHGERQAKRLFQAEGGLHTPFRESGSKRALKIRAII